ncbi:hypothetical protein [Azotobacter vinelandii]|uniref:hypothetical protein n=1 Tax=Azotobacter vinelandii TaxID=354 RepID=UPI002665D342|nr:hypothetical protein [Azotobacter vinelandii]WKN20870.1 hypothetical protein AVAEIV_003896 [Azotobacter vinelandii]
MPVETYSGTWVLSSEHDRIVSSLAEAGRKMQAERDQFQRLYNAASAELCQIGEALGVPEDDQCTPEILERIAVLGAERDALRAEVEALRADADLFRRLRSVPDDLLGVPGVPCVAVPEGPNSGRFVSGADLDAALEASR